MTTIIIVLGIVAYVSIETFISLLVWGGSGFLVGLIGLNAISDFVVDMSSNTPQTAARNELWINVLIVPVESINFILIPIRLANSVEQA